MSADVPNAFAQAEMPERKPGEDRTIVKITGALVDVLLRASPDQHTGHVVCENGKKVLCVEAL